MNKLLLTLSLLVAFLTKISAQIPDGYYESTEGKTGDELKLALYHIIKTQVMKSYGDARYILDEADVDPNNASNVLVIYSPHSVSGAWDAGKTWNREHVWAKSRGIGDVDNSTKGAGSDLHNLRACIPEINTDRGNAWFGECETPYIYNGEETGTYYNSSEWLWEPRDEDKGDVARIIFYMATRYEGDGSEPDLEVIDYLPENNFTNDPVHALLSDLISWHHLDPVSKFERDRNDVIYSYQQNRNPYIDHPEYVGLIWGGGNSVENSLYNEVKLYPNPAKSIVNIETVHPFKMLTIYTIDGRLLRTESFKQNIDISFLKPGNYFVKLDNNSVHAVLPMVIMP